MLEGILHEIEEYEGRIADFLIQITQIKSMLAEAYNMDEKSINAADQKVEATKIPFVAYEMQLERHLEEKKDLLDRNEAEKDKMRKHYRNIIVSMAVALSIMIIGVFATIIWFFSNYDILSFAQDATYGNANFIGNDGDITNGTADYPIWPSEESESKGSSDK